MINENKLKNHLRMNEIEENKIAILLEIAGINNKYKDDISRLNCEYNQLDKEYSQLRLLSVKIVGLPDESYSVDRLRTPGGTKAQRGKKTNSR
jgi:hypothetical protein